MEGKRLIHKITLKNFLSYGAEMEPFELQPLNVLIGPNASGKSNLIAAMSLLQAAPTDVLLPLREGGGASEWIWKGGEGGGVAEIAVGVEYPGGGGPVTYQLAFGALDQRFALYDEVVVGPAGKYDYNERRDRAEALEPVARNQSALGQRMVRDRLPELAYLADVFETIRIYREWNAAPGSALREPQRTDAREDFLSENGSNLALVLNDLDSRPGGLEPLIQRLQRFYEPVTRISTRVIGGTVQLMVHERGLKEAIPATRLSDGMLRYLCLLSILCHPEPPPLVCIEEPELGLHPDALHSVGELLVEASQRTQLIVTTHSDRLVSALGDVPEAVVVCERTDAGTQLSRLDPGRLHKWLERYSLGELWSMGEIGGNP